jgi:hypothetical protein
MKTNHFLLAAGIVLAMAFTFSCSSGDDPDDNSSGGGGNFNPSDLPKQVYIDYHYNGKEFNELFDGNAEILLILRWQDEYNRYFSDTLPAGKIQNGQVALNLPNIDSKYLTKTEFTLCDIENYYKNRDPYELPSCESNVSYPRNLAGFLQSSFQLLLTDKGLCEDFYLRPADEDAEEGIFFMYFSESGKITGTAREEDEYGTTISNYNMNVSKGWNIVWGTNLSDDDPCDYFCEPKPYEPYYEEASYYTSSKSLKNFEWHAYCHTDIW